MRNLTTSFISKVVQSSLLVSCVAFVPSAHAVSAPSVPVWALLTPPPPVTPPAPTTDFNLTCQLFSGVRSYFNPTAGSTATLYNTLATRLNGKTIPPYLKRVDAITGNAPVKVGAQSTNIYSYLTFSRNQTPSKAGANPAVSTVSALRFIIKLNRSYVGDVLSFDATQYPRSGAKPDQSNRARSAELFLDTYLPGFRNGLSLYNVFTDGFSSATAEGNRVITVGGFSQVKAKITVTNNSGAIQVSALYSWIGKGDVSPLSDEVQLEILQAEAQLEGAQ